MSFPHEVQVRELDVVCLVLETHVEVLPGFTLEEYRAGVPVQRVDEPAHLQPAVGKRDAAILQRRAAMNVERAQARVKDALGRRDSAGNDQRPSSISQLVVNPGVEPRLRCSLVGKVWIRRLGGAGNRAARAQERFLCQKTSRDLVGKPVADGGSVCHIDRKHAAAVVRFIDGRPIELPEANPDARPLHLTGRLRDDIDHTAHRVRAPDCRGRAANHFDLFDLSRRDRQKVPHDGAEEILVDRSSIEEHQQGV